MRISGDLFIFIVILKSLDQVQLISCDFKEIDGVNARSVVSQLFK